MSTVETNHTETTNVTNTTPSDESLNVDTPTNPNTTTTTSVRKRTRATAEQLSVLEDTFAANVSPNSKLRKELSERLQMSERSIQIWFQNRRAKVKHVQKRAQMQMQQASIRAQLYHYHQQQYGMQQPYGGASVNAPIMPLPQQQQHMYAPSRVPLPRSASMDHPHPPSLPTPPASSASLDPSIPPTHLLSSSYPSQDTMEFPDYLHGNANGAGGPLSPSLSPHQVHPPPVVAESPTNASSMPSLVAVPDAGPTAMLATASSTSVSSSSTSTDPLVSTPDQTTVSPQDIWPTSVHQNEHMMRSQSVSISSSLPTGNNSCPTPTGHPLERSLSNPPMTTIDPSNLMMNSSSNNDTTDQQQQYQHPPITPPPPPPSTTDIYLNCTTLTIGTWHRLKLRASDLLCTFRTTHQTFEWQIEDAGCHFKMEIPLSSVANIDMVQDPHGFADVHFDISESPLFYMETSATHWVQCSDFTEGKQASRFFRHSLKGVATHLKHDLMTLMDQCPDTRRWIRFVETTTPPHYQQQVPAYPPPPKQQQLYYGQQQQQHHSYAVTTTTPTETFMAATNELGSAYDPSMYMPPPQSLYWYQAPPPPPGMVGMAPPPSLV